MKTWRVKKSYKRNGRIVHAHKQRYSNLSKAEVSKIAQQKRRKGLKFEYKILSKMKKQYPDTTFRSAGSHSLIDVLVREPGKLRYIVARTNGYLAPHEKKELETFDQPYEQVELWHRPTEKTIKKEYLKKAGVRIKKGRTDKFLDELKDQEYTKDKDRLVPELAKMGLTSKEVQDWVRDTEKVRFFKEQDKGAKNVVYESPGNTISFNDEDISEGRRRNNEGYEFNGRRTRHFKKY